MDGTSTENLHRAATMSNNLWSHDFAQHLKGRADEGSKPHRDAFRAVRDVSRWVAKSGLGKQRHPGSFTLGEGRSALSEKDTEIFNEAYGAMLESHDRVARDLRKEGFGEYLDSFTEARLAPLEGQGQQRAQPQVAQSSARPSESLDEFIRSLPKDQVQAMSQAGFNGYDMAGQYLMHAMLTSNESEIDRIAALGINLETPMSKSFCKALSNNSPEGMHLSHYAALMGDRMPKASLERISPEHSGVGAKDADGNTPLHYAAMTSDVSRVKLWTEKGADPRARNEGGLTPSMNAGTHGRNENTAFLEKAAQQSKQEAIRQAAERRHQSKTPGTVAKRKPRGNSGRDAEL
jgi:hypothetical protein